MYQVIPDANETWRVRNLLSGRDVVTRMSREGANRLKDILTRNLQTRREAMGQNKGVTTDKQ